MLHCWGLRLSRLSYNALTLAAKAAAAVAHLQGQHAVDWKKMPALVFARRSSADEFQILNTVTLA
jgi:hypothetical protein